jgi:hypothetical protein
MPYMTDIHRDFFVTGRTDFAQQWVAYGQNVMEFFVNGRTEFAQQCVAYGQNVMEFHD